MSLSLNLFNCGQFAPASAGWTIQFRFAVDITAPAWLSSIREREDALSKAKDSLENQVAERLQQERAKIAADEARKAKLALAGDLNEKTREVADLQEILKQREGKLAEAQKAQADLLRKQRELDDARRELEGLLKTKFPRDTIEPVPKGEPGGDVLHRVLGPLGQSCGTILWESKRTKNWSDGWLAKLRDDQRAAKAEISVIVSRVLPKDVETFGLVEGVWVAHPQAVLPVAVTLRYALIEIATARQASEGQQTKMEMVYQYLTGPRFSQRIHAIAEAFGSMKGDLDKEKRAITKRWAKREEQIERVIQATVGMYGDLQGIAGKSLQEIEGLELKALEDSPAPSMKAD